jgi:acyl-CoA thioesterase-1
VLVLGNSIAAGSGVAPEEAFPARLQHRVDSLGWNVEIINGGVSGETTAGGLRRLDWLLRQSIDVLIVELGGNDGLRGTDLSATRENLQAIIDTAKAQYPDVRILLAGMQLPPNLGPDYTQRFRALYPTLAEQNENVGLIPFLLEGVGGVDSLMQSDGIHPTADGQRIVAQNVWAALKPMLQSLRQEA